MSRIGRVSVILCAAVLLVAAVGANASPDSWTVSFKAVSSTFSGGSAVTVGVGTSPDLSLSWPGTPGSTVTAISRISPPGNLSRQLLDRDTVPPEQYQWNLKMGARAEYAGSTMNICLWSSLPSGYSLGEPYLNTDLVYVFGKTTQTLAWFSAPGIREQYIGSMDGMSLGTWHDIAVLEKANTWTPSLTSTGFFLTEDAVKGSSWADLADYHFTAFNTVPEPGSLLALGSGLLGAAGLALRRRKQ